MTDASETRVTPQTHIIVEEVTRGQWRCTCPDGWPRAMTNYVRAMTGALFWAAQGGYGVFCINFEGERHLALGMDTARLAARWNGGEA